MLKEPKLSWINGQPFSDEYQDIYFSPDAASEVERIFINPTNLDAVSREKPQTTILELGFGAGLNFCVTAQRFLDQNTKNRLHFISFEKHPFSKKDYAKTFANLDPVIPFSSNLIDQVPALLPGWHRRSFFEGRINLSIFYGEAKEGLRDITIRHKVPIDFCFLDGFNPAHNPELWSEELLLEISKNLHADSQITTFTAAGRIKRRLEKLGFEIIKVDQRPIKRESLFGVYKGPVLKQAYRAPREVHILGAGIAGATVARHLAEAAINVHIWDPNGSGSGASRISASLLHGRLLGDQTADADFRVNAFHYSNNFLKSYSNFNQCGVLQINGSNMSTDKMLKIKKAYPSSNGWLQLLNQKEIEDFSGVKVRSKNALWFPDGGSVNLRGLCQELLNHPKIQLNVRKPELDPHVAKVIATGAHSLSDYPRTHLETYSIDGQIDFVKTKGTPFSPIVGDGYLVPIENNLCAIGATYEYQTLPPNVATKQNLLRNFSIKLQSSVGYERGARCVSSDRVPVIGEFSNNCWISNAHGSLGTSSAPLAASIISSKVIGWIPPINRDVEKIVDPYRFKERQDRRGQLKSTKLFIK
ncbi:MAG: tRNA (5-methylaminomethyl-2-thiouridine)(34)-methyltransferase MnmD [Candidatus Azotimanducaceae bacterium]